MSGTYYEPEDLGPKQDARDSKIPGRKYYVYVLETDFGHYVGHTARLHERLNEHLRGDPTTMNSNPKPAWNSGPLATRRDAQKFEAALKSLRDQRSRRFKDYTGLEPELFTQYNPDSYRAEGQRHSTKVKIGNDIQTAHSSEDPDPRHDYRRNKPFDSFGNNRRYRHREAHDRQNRDVGTKASRIDMKKTLTWFIVVFVLTSAIGYGLGFRDAQVAVGLFSYVGMFVVAGTVFFAAFWWRQNFGRAFRKISGIRSLTGPIAGDRRNSRIAIVVASILGSATGGFLGYNLGLSTAHGVIQTLTMIGAIVFLAALLAIAGYVIVKWRSSQRPQVRRSGRRRRG